MDVLNPRPRTRNVPSVMRGVPYKGPSVYIKRCGHDMWEVYRNSNIYGVASTHDEARTVAQEARRSG